MRFDVELQYAEFHPDQVEKIGPLDLDQTLKIIHAYPWDREFDKIEKRTAEDLTSTVPNIAIRNKSNEMLIVSARDKENFILEFLTPTHRGQQIISTNSFNNKQALTTEVVVERFFEGTAEELFKLNPFPDTAAADVDAYKFKKHHVFFSWLLLGVLVFILLLDLLANGFTSEALPAIYFVGIMAFAFGLRSIVTIHYFMNDRGKEVTFGENSITITQNGKEVRIDRNDITEVAIIESEHRDRNKMWMDFRYARIKTKDEKAFIVTSFIMEPMELVNKLRVNHKEEWMLIPLIRLDIQSEREKAKIKRERERKKIEFLENFKDHKDSKLREIIRDKDNYADYAVAAATEILEKRKQSPVSK